LKKINLFSVLNRFLKKYFLRLFILHNFDQKQALFFDRYRCCMIIDTGL